MILLGHESLGPARSGTVTVTGFRTVSVPMVIGTSMPAGASLSRLGTLSSRVKLEFWPGPVPGRPQSGILLASLGSPTGSKAASQALP
jgi:hypothetical protein